jgi:hypothetical protein
MHRMHNRVHLRLGYYFWDKGLKDYVALDLVFIMIVRPNPPPLSVRSPSSGFGLTCLRWDGFGCGRVLWWLKCPIPCLVCASPSGYSPFPFTIGHLYFLWVFELLTRLSCWVHGARINSSCDFGLNYFTYQSMNVEQLIFIMRLSMQSINKYFSHQIPHVTPHHTQSTWQSLNQTTLMPKNPPHSLLSTQFITMLEVQA